MKKEEFLALAEQVFDQINPQGEESKISIDKSLFDEIVDQVGSEINDLGRDLIENYELEMYSNEVTLENVTLENILPMLDWPKTLGKWERKNVVIMVIKI